VKDDLQHLTIRDFGVQWTRYSNLTGYLGSLDLLADTLAPLVDVAEIRERRVADIGSGTGRVVRQLLAAGAAHVVALEPSDAFTVLVSNTADAADRVTCLRQTGDALPPSGDLDFVFALGVLHHIPDPGPVVRAARAALRPGGRLVAWLYAREGNALYLAAVRPVRAVTTRLPAPALAALVRLIDLPLCLYVRASAVLPLPMRRYMRDVLGRLSGAHRRLTIYDQLNPRYARYYTRADAEALLTGAGFEAVRLEHRHGYSWLVTGRTPGGPPPGDAR